MRSGQHLRKALKDNSSRTSLSGQDRSPARSSTWQVGIMAEQAAWQTVTLGEQGDTAPPSSTCLWFVRCAAIVGIAGLLGIGALLICWGRRRRAIVA
jgi:hypothetical protein